MPDPEVPIVPPAVPPAGGHSGGDNGAESSVIKAMRAQLEAALEEKKKADKAQSDLAAQLKSIQDAQMTEQERLKKENEELRPVRDAHGKFASKLEALYTQELGEVPEEKRAAVEALSKAGDFADRLDALRNAKQLLGTAAAPPPAPVGDPANPGTRQGAGNPPAPAPFDPKNPPRLGDVFRKK